MRPRIKGSNWETIAFLLIDALVDLQKPHFTRSQLMTADNLTRAVKILSGMGHKERPDHPDMTLQKTIQNLRDQGCIEFLGRGEYRLTEKGFKRMNEEYEAAKSFLETLRKARESS